MRRIPAAALLAAGSIGVLGAAPAAFASSLSAPCTGTTGDAAALVADITEANLVTGPDTVQLSPGCTYTLTAVDNYWYGPNALPPIASDITIDGQSATIERASSAPPMRLFFVGADQANASTLGYTSPGAGVLTLRDVTITGGLAEGGDSDGGGGGAGMGGAIFSQGTVMILDSTLTGNTARGGSGIDGSAGLGGGGIGTNSTSTAGGGFGAGSFGGAAGGDHLEDGGAGGGAGFAGTETGGNATLTSTGGSGGGPATGLGGIGGSNTTAGDGGGSGGSSFATPDDGAGGAFGVGGADGSGANAAGGGAGVGGGGGAGVGNWGAGGGGFGGGGGFAPTGTPGSGGFGGGGAIGNGKVGSPGFGGGTPQLSVDPGGGAGMGGAVFNMQGTLGITDSTLAANSAIGGEASSAEGGQGIGGAVFNLSGTVTAVASTFAGNTAADGAAQLYNLVYDAHTARTATMTLRDTIVARGVGPDDLASVKTTDIVGTPLGSATADLSQFDLVNELAPGSVDQTGTVTGSPLTADPQLGPLQDNGGPTETEAPAAGSPAIDAGGPGCTDLTGAPLRTDQRGALRPAGAACDIGAVERAVPGALTGPATAVGEGGANLNATATNPDLAAGSVSFQYGTTTRYGSTTPAATLLATTSGPVSAAILGLTPGRTYHYRVVVHNDLGTVDGADRMFTTPAGRPVLSHLRIAPSRLRAPGSATVTFDLSAPARVRFTVARSEAGRREMHGRCGAPARSNRHGRRCVRVILLKGSFTFAGRRGPNHLQFTGRLRGRPLAPGGYLLKALPTAGSRTGAPATVSFTIKG